MRTWKQLLIVILAAVIALPLMLPSTTYAQDPGGDRDRAFSMFLVNRALMTAAAEALGITSSEVRQSLDEGQSLNDLLAANGIDPTTVIDAAKTTINERLGEAVANGRLPQERADEFLAGLDVMISEAMADTMPLQDRVNMNGGARTLLETAAESLGISVQDLLRSIEPGQTLSDAIIAQGGDPVAIAEQAKAEITAQVEADLAAGEISQERADLILNNLDTAIDRRLNESIGRRDNREGRREERGERRGERTGEMQDLLETITAELGLEPMDLLQQMREGKTLSQIITENGGDVEVIVDLLMTTITERINTAVSEGNLSQERADQILADLEDRIRQGLEEGFNRGGFGNRGEGNGVLQ